MAWFGEADGVFGSTGKFLSGLGTIYAAYNQNKASKDMLDWQKRVWKNNQGLLGQMQSNLDSAIDNVYGQSAKKKTTGSLGDFASAYSEVR